MQFNQAIAEKLILKFEGNLSKYKKMYDYYKGKTDTEALYAKIEGRSNDKVFTNYVKKFITEHIAYGVGNPITYTHTGDNEDAIKDISYNTRVQKANLDSTLFKKMLIFGKSYEIAYIKDEMLKYKVTDPTNSIAYTDDEDNVQMFIHFFYKDLDETRYMDIYCDEGIYHLDADFVEVEDFTDGYLEVPVSIAALDEEENETIYNDIKTLQDAFEKAISNWLNNDNDFRDSYFYTKNVETDEDFADKMKTERVIELPNADSEAGFITKDANADYTNRLIDVLKDMIYQISQSINSNEAMQSNTSGVAILSRIINLRNRINLEQQCLHEAIKNRLKILFKYLKLIDGKDYDYRDIDIKFTMNVPSDDAATANIISLLKGVLPAEIGLNQLSFITNGKAAFEKALEEAKKKIQAETPQVDFDKEDNTEVINNG